MKTGPAEPSRGHRDCVICETSQTNGLKTPISRRPRMAFRLDYCFDEMAASLEMAASMKALLR
jgi:hypothetical protein